MKQESNRIARVAVPLMAATLLSTPLMAQDAAAPASVTPPSAAAPVQVTPPATVTVTPPPVAAAPAPQATPATNSASAGADPQSATPVNPEAAAAAEAEAQERAAAARPVRSQRAAAPRAAPVRAAAAPAVNEPAPSPVPVAASAPPAPPVATTSPAARPAPAPVTESTQQTQATSGTPIWPFVVGALVVLAGIAALLIFRRREEETVWEEPVYTDSVEAQPMTIEPAAPVATAAAAPAVLDLANESAVATPEEASISDAPAADIEALTAGETVTGRPWLEFAMRPVRAGTNDDEALVEIELTVGNAGEVAAKDVRISTFMLTAESSDVEQMLMDPPANAVVEPVTIDAGEGTRVDATLALPRSAVNGHFQPIVVADARYRLPDGSEGRTSASFVLGVSDDGVFSPLDTARNEMRDDIEAQLYRDPQRA